MSYIDELKRLQDVFMDDISHLSDFDNEDEAATFVMACVDWLEEVAQLTGEHFGFSVDSTDEIFEILFTSRKLDTNYSELYGELASFQDSIDYGELYIDEDETIDFEDRCSSMEKMIRDLIELEEAEE